MRMIVSVLALAAVGCGNERMTRAGGDTIEEESAPATSSRRANGLYSDTLSASLVVVNDNVPGIQGIDASAGGQRVYLSMGTVSCSVTENGAMDYDVDVDPGGDTGDTGAGGVLGTGEEEVIGTGEEEFVLIASPNALYRVDAPGHFTERLAIPRAVAAAERAGQLTVLDDQQSLQRFQLGEGGGIALQWAVQLDRTAPDMSVRGDDVFVAGEPVQHVDAQGRVRLLQMTANQVVADISGDLLTRNGDRIDVFGPDHTLRWSFKDGVVSDVGMVAGRDLVWAHYASRNGENQVVLLDRLTGEVGEGLGDGDLERVRGVEVGRGVPPVHDAGREHRRVLARAVHRDRGARATRCQQRLAGSVVEREVGWRLQVRLGEPRPGEDATGAIEVHLLPRVGGAGQSEQVGRELEPLPDHRQRLDRLVARARQGRTGHVADRPLDSAVDREGDDSAVVVTFDEAGADDLGDDGLRRLHELRPKSSSRRSMSSSPV